MFFPDYTYYNQVDPFNSPFYSRQDHLRSKEMERRQRIKQQQQDAERRRRIKQLEALEKQREREEMVRQQQRELMHKREKKRVAHQGENKYAFPPGTIIRGRDGRLYRVVEDPHIHQGIQVNHDDQSASSNSSESDTNSCTTDYSTEQECANNNCNANNVKYSDSKDSLHATASDFISKSTVEANSNLNIPKKTITLVVEDVPIEEDEELRDLNSVWRNRMPSKGEWMEPVESFTR